LAAGAVAAMLAEGPILRAVRTYFAQFSGN
jgi:hypothetical protein